jgi:hypothetical protein
MSKDLIERTKAHRFTSETAREAQKKGVEKRKENQFSAELAQKMLNAPTLNEDEKERLRQYGIADPAQWQVMMQAVAEEAKQGNYKAFETLLKIARLYVEKTESKTENVNKTEFTNLDEWKEYVKSLNE